MENKGLQEHTTESPLVTHLQSNSAYQLSISNEQLDILAGSRELPFKEMYYLFVGAFLGALPGLIQSVISLSDYRNLTNGEFYFSLSNVVYFSFIIMGLSITSFFFFKEHKKKDILIAKIRTQTVPMVVVSMPKTPDLFAMMSVKMP